MKQKIFFSTLILMCLCQSALGQNVVIPSPTRFYTLDSLSTNDAINPSNNGNAYGTLQFTDDRFYNPVGAMYIRPHSGITIPELNDIYGDISTGFTYSFWTYIPQPISKNQGIRPWADDDEIYRYLSINYDTIPLYGFERIRDRMVINRYVYPGHYTRPRDWKLWMWDPTNFTEQTGWYHIVMVCERSRTWSFIFKPNGEIASNMHYLRFQDLLRTGVLTEFGSIRNDLGIFLDDFKFFNRAFTRDEVMQLHGEDASPQGMYLINSALPGNRFMHTAWSSYDPDTTIEIFDYLGHRQSTFKWVIDPVEDQKNLYHIRLAYTNLFLGTEDNITEVTTPIQIRTATNPIDSVYREWIITPVPNEIGYYYIRLSVKPTMYLRVGDISGDNSASLELNVFLHTQAQAYKWKLNFINSNYELRNNPLADKPNDPKIIVSDLNTFLQILPDQFAPIAPVYGIINHRWDNPINNAMLWYLTPTLDGSFYMGSQVPDFNLAPESYDVQTSLVSTWVQNFNPSVSHAFRWIMDRSDNIFGSRYRIQLAANPLVELSPAMDFSPRIHTAIRAETRAGSTVNPRSQRWMFFNTQKDSNTPPNEQLYHISPGVYRIQLAADTTKSITTENNQFIPNARLIIDNINRQQELSHYWFIDFERTPSGEPIKDGTYLIKLIGTDQYMHTAGNVISSSARLDIFHMGVYNIGTNKFFIRSEGGGLYSIALAADPHLIFHTVNNETNAGTPLEVYPYVQGVDGVFRWRFQKVNLNDAIEDGDYLMKSFRDTTLAVVTGTKDGLIEPSDIVTLRRLTDGQMKWTIKRDRDGTYMIYVATINPHLYIRPRMGIIAERIMLEILHSNSAFVRFPFSYRWVVVNTDWPNTYRFRIVGPGDLYMHIQNNNAQPSFPLELYPFDQSLGSAYEWVLSQ